MGIIYTVTFTIGSSRLSYKSHGLRIRWFA